MFKVWLETSFQQLYDSTVDAYPLTTKRQHSTDSIRIEQLQWTPFLGTRTLLLRGLANNFQGGGKEYRPIILFKGVQYHDAAGPGLVEVFVDGQVYHLEPLSRDTDILVRCQCGDEFWRFRHYNVGCRYGPDRKPYEAHTNRGPVNPTNAKGCCKHLMKMFYALEDSGLVI